MIRADGAIDTSTTTTWPYGTTSSNPISMHNLASIDGTSFYTAYGGGYASPYGGYYSVPYGVASSSGTAIAATLTAGYPGTYDARAVGVFNGQLVSVNRDWSAAAAAQPRQLAHACLRAPVSPFHAVPFSSLPLWCPPSVRH